MIYATINLTIGEKESTCDDIITLYRGDRNVQIRFVLINNIFTVINQTYAQLIVIRPRLGSLFTSIEPITNNTVVLTITEEMIDEITESGKYSFQIRLYDDAKTSRVTLPPCKNGLCIEEPLAIEDQSVIDEARINYSTLSDSDDEENTFNEDGSYNRTEWLDGDIISDVRMNKIEDAIYNNRDDINTITQALASLEEPPTYVHPTANFSVTPSLIEQGVMTSVQLSYSYNQNDGGPMKEVAYYVGTEVVDNQPSIDETTQFKMILTYDDGPIKETNLGNPYPDTSIKSGQIDKTVTVTAIGMSYYGVGQATNKTLKNTRNFTWNNISCEKDILVYKYPKSLGALSSIKDANNFDYINSYARTEETINNIVYYVYTLIDPMSITGFKQIYS